MNAKLIAIVSNINFTGDATKIPHYYFEQAQRLTSKPPSTGNIKAVVAASYDQAKSKLKVLAAKYVEGWFGFQGGALKLSDFNFEISFTEVDEGGEFWLIPSTTYCEKVKF